jgi:hypothetical protein
MLHDAFTEVDDEAPTRVWRTGTPSEAKAHGARIAERANELVPATERLPNIATQVARPSSAPSLVATQRLRQPAGPRLRTEEVGAERRAMPAQACPSTRERPPSVSSAPTRRRHWVTATVFIWGIAAGILAVALSPRSDLGKQHSALQRSAETQPRALRTPLPQLTPPISSTAVSAWGSKLGTGRAASTADPPSRADTSPLPSCAVSSFWDADGIKHYQSQCH